MNRGRGRSRQGAPSKWLRCARLAETRPHGKPSLPPPPAGSPQHLGNPRPEFRHVIILHFIPQSLPEHTTRVALAKTRQ